MHLTFCAEWGKTKKFSRFCLDAVAGHFSCGFLQCLPFAGIKISSGVIHAGLLKPGAQADLDLPLDVRRKMWFKPFMQSYLVVFIGYLTMYLIRKNFNIAQNDMISTYGLSMTELGMIGLASRSPMAWENAGFLLR